MILKSKYAKRLRDNTELRLEMALNIGVTPLTIYRALGKNDEGRPSRLTSRLGLKFLKEKFGVEESQLTKVA
jgi:hypothetical protein